MPSKKPNKAAKRPDKATPKKAVHKAAAPKKAARPPTAMLEVARAQPNSPVRLQNPAIENVMSTTPSMRGCRRHLPEGFSDVASLATVGRRAFRLELQHGSAVGR